jgi:cellulose synthase/poly-beta-1,6-N-acetylglucosamine synthase-like glycosyltransferase
LAANQRDGETIGNDAALKISVIIPALNEAKNLPQTLAAVRTANGIEVVIVDGGSQDETVKVAKSFQAKVIAAPPGRAMQMNWEPMPPPETCCCSSMPILAYPNSGTSGCGKS